MTDRDGAEQFFESLHDHQLLDGIVNEMKVGATKHLRAKGINDRVIRIVNATLEGASRAAAISYLEAVAVKQINDRQKAA